MQKKVIFSWAIAIIVCVVVAIMGTVTYPFADDLKYYYYNTELLERIGEANPLPDIGYIFADDYINSNGRLATPLYDLAVALLPRWVTGLAEGIILAFIFLLIYRLTILPGRSNTVSVKEDVNTPIAISLTTLLVLLGYPWNDNMFLVGYYLPYLADIALILFCVVIFLKKLWLTDRSTISTVIGCICMLVAGMWHEGNALCVFGPMCVIWMFGSSKARKPMTLMVMALCIGIIYTLISPATGNRTDEVAITLNPANWFQPYTLTGGVWLLPHIVLPILYLAVILCVAILKRTRIAFKGFTFRKWVKDGFPASPSVVLQLLCVLVTATNLAMGLFFNMPRAMIPGITFSIIGLVSLTTGLIPRIRHDRKHIVIGLWTGSTILTLFILTACVFNIPLQMKFSEEQRQVEKLMGESPDGQVFFDPTPYPHYNKYPWQWACNDYYVNYVSLHFLTLHPANRNHNPVRVIPTDLKDLPYNIVINGITRLGENFISDKEPAYTSGYDLPRYDIYKEEYPFLKINAEVKTASGKRDIRFFEIIPFTTAKATSAQRDLYYFRPVWRSYAEINDPAVDILTVSPAKYW